MDALLVVDMQNGCFDGTPPRYEAEAMILRIRRLVDAFRRTGLVVFIQHTDSNEGFAAGTRAWEIVDGLGVQANDIFIQKAACDSFLETDLDSFLHRNQVQSVTIVGCATDFCVDTTVRAAASLDYLVTVPSDGHTTRDRPHLPATSIMVHHNYMWSDLLLPRGRKIRVIPVENLLAEMDPV